jgi:cytoskeletal protein RodZ
MSTVAEQLRLGREAKKLTIYQVAEVTKIRTDHIRALEEGNYDVFSAPVYVRGFVRTYAGLLKLDVAAIMTELTLELSKSAKLHEPPPLMDRRRGLLDMAMYQLSKLNWRIVAPAAALVLILILAFSIHNVLARRKAEAPSPPKPAPVYQGSKKQGDVLPLTPPPAPSSGRQR